MREFFWPVVDQTMHRRIRELARAALEIKRESLLLIELEDTKKLLDGGFVRREREIRPTTPAELITEVPPLDQEQGKTSRLEQFRG